MSKCKFCPKCDVKSCPKKGRADQTSKKSVTLSAPLSRKLTSFCEENNIMTGEKYYRVPDYNSAIMHLLDARPKKEKKTRGKRSTRA
ncbi:MAG: hypothetical protein ABH875_07275 [Candidatus Omnitrophota bacterium]